MEQSATTLLRDTLLTLLSHFCRNTWPESHHGPVITYLAPVAGEFADVAKADLSFVKIQADGLNDGTTAPGVWASDDMMGMCR